MSFNKIIIVGNLGRDPELNYTPQGKAVCKLAVASNEKRRNSKSGELENITTWFRVTLWEKKAEAAAKYLTKGSSVYLEGRLHAEEWTDRDRKSRTTLEVAGSDMQFLGSNSEGGNDGGGSERARSAGAGFTGGGSNNNGDDFPEMTGGAAEIGDDDVPF